VIGMVIAVIGVQALYLLFIWLASAIVASYLSGRKGFGERVGLASGLLVPVLSVIVWLIWPARAESDWKVVGPFGRQKVDEDEALSDRPSVGGEGAGAGGTPA
jgi:hypothetical protein